MNSFQVCYFQPSACLANALSTLRYSSILPTFPSLKCNSQTDNNEPSWRSKLKLIAFICRLMVGCLQQFRSVLFLTNDKYQHRRIVDFISWTIEWAFGLSYNFVYCFCQGSVRGWSLQWWHGARRKLSKRSLNLPLCRCRNGSFVY